MTDKFGWPYPRINRLVQGEWLETSESTYWDQLECVPPACMKGGGFMVGEAATHNERGIPVHAAFVEYNGRYFCKNDAITNFNIGKYRTEIIAQIERE